MTTTAPVSTYTDLVTHSAASRVLHEKFLYREQGESATAALGAALESSVLTINELLLFFTAAVITEHENIASGQTPTSVIPALPEQHLIGVNIVDPQDEEAYWQALLNER